MITHLPYVANEQGISAQGDECPLTLRAAQFTQVWLSLLGDRARLMTCDPRLVACAQDHANYLAQREDTSPSLHVGQGGSTPNERVRAAGYELPDFWPVVGNQVESASRTWADVADDMAGIVGRLMAHDTHHDHMTVSGWFSGHTIYGVGAASEPSGSTYFVIDSALRKGE